MAASDRPPTVNLSLRLHISLIVRLEQLRRDSCFRCVFAGMYTWVGSLKWRSLARRDGGRGRWASSRLVFSQPWSAASSFGLGATAAFAVCSPECILGLDHSNGGV